MATLLPTPPPKHPNEEARLAALHSFGIIDTPAEEAFDDITRLLADICDVPIALVTLIDNDRQWFKSAVGAGEITETPRGISFCAHALLQPDIMVVPDTYHDARFIDNPLVTNEPYIRFYAGALLQTGAGLPLGTLCILDTKPRTLSDREKNALRVLAREVMTQIELRQRVRQQEIVIAEREQARDELSKAVEKHQRVAETLQRSLLLAPPPDAFPGLRVAHFYESAWDEALVGGDFYDLFALRNHKVALVVGDVAGKGLAAAAYTAEIKFALRSFLREGCEPAEAFARLNHVVMEGSILDRVEESARGVYVALVAAVVDTQTGTVLLASAGAEPPLVLRGDCGCMEEVDTSGVFIGAYEDAVFSQTTLQLKPNDTLLLFSDGITEARRKPDFFGPEGITQAALCAHNGLGSTPATMGQAILSAAHTWAGGKLHDDACLVLARLEAAAAPNTETVL